MDQSRTMILARRAEIAKLRKALDDEERELEAAERVIKRLAAASKHGKGANGARLPPMTHEDLVLATLLESESPWFANTAALREEIKRTFNKDIKKTTLAPLISQLIGGKKIARGEQGIALVERASKAV